MSYRNDADARSALDDELQRRHATRKAELEGELATRRAVIKVLRESARDRGGSLARPFSLASKPIWYVASYYVLLVIALGALGFIAGAGLTARVLTKGAPHHGVRGAR